MQLPSRTIVNRRIPKQKLYEHAKLNSKLAAYFTGNIAAIYWRNSLSAETLNVSSQGEITEIEVLEIILKSEDTNSKALEVINGAIPYPIVFLLSHGEKSQIWMEYKKSTDKNPIGKITQYYHTDWTVTEDLELPLIGLALETIYDNLFLQIAGNQLEVKENEKITDALARTREESKLTKEIERLEKMARAEKQPKKKYELYNRIQQLRGEK